MPPVAPRAKVLEYRTAVDRLGAISAEGGGPAALPKGWEPEHLVLAAFVRCSIASLRYHACRLGADVLASGRAHAKVTRRESDGRYAFVELEGEFDVELEPAQEDLATLLEQAERDCFIGASLTVEPAYHWTVNGTRIG